MAAKKIYSTEFKRKCVELYQTKTAREVYESIKEETYGVTYAGFRSQLKRWKNKTVSDQKILDGANLTYKSYPKNATVQVDSEGNVRQAWVRTTPDKEISYIDILKDTLSTIKPIDKIEVSKQETSNRLLEIPLDDLHFGVSNYKDYKNVLKQVVQIIQSRKWECIFVPFGADLIHCDNFNGETSNGTYLGEYDFPKAFRDALRFYRELFVACLENSESVECYYTQGNHSNTGSWTLLQTLKTLYPSIKYNDEVGDDKMRKVFHWNKIFIGLTHGDTISKNLSVIKEIFVEEFLKEYYESKTKEIHVSHLHHEKETGDVNGCLVRRLPTGVKKDGYHKKHGWTMSVERFQIFEYDHNNLKDVHYIDR